VPVATVPPIDFRAFGAVAADRSRSPRPDRLRSTAWTRFSVPMYRLPSTNGVRTDEEGQTVLHP
jgi:hypothetical protein